MHNQIFKATMKENYDIKAQNKELQEEKRKNKKRMSGRGKTS